MTERFDQIDAQLARIEKNMATVLDLRIAVFGVTMATITVAAFALWLA